MNAGETFASAARVAAWRRLCKPRLASAPAGEEADPGRLDPADRREQAQASRLVRGVLRNLSLLDAGLERLGLFDPRKTPPPLLWVLRLAAYERIFQAQAPDYAIGAQAVELGRLAGGDKAARFVNAILRRLLPSLPGSPEALGADSFFRDLPLARRTSVPEDIYDALGQGYHGLQLEALFQALAEEEAPVWLRVNTLQTTPQRLRDELAAAGCLVEPFDPAPGGEALRWVGGALPWATQPWRRGELTVQDLGAMAAAWLLAPEPGQAVLDLCAAPGGKTGHLWETMQAQGRLVALERDLGRRAELREAMARLYGSDHRIEIPDAGPEAYPPAADFDRVLLDAPCQAFGLIRRHPEIRWDRRIRYQDRMQAAQRALLESGARFVKPGGRLLWVTCSPTLAENEAVVNLWLARSPGWRIVDPRPLLPPRLWPLLQCDAGALRTRPDRLACDGFAMILLERLGG